MRFLCACLLLASVAQAKDTLRLQHLPAEHRQEPPRALALADENLRVEPILVVLNMRAQQLAEPRSRVPSFVPLFGTACIGGSLRMDF